MINGALLRSLRKKKHLTLSYLAEKTGYTASFLSQIERNLKEPSLTALRSLSESLGVPMVSLLLTEERDTEQINAADGEQGNYYLVAGNERKPIPLPGLSTKCEALTPAYFHSGSHHNLQGIIYTVSGGEFASEDMVSHPYDECAYLLSGEVTVTLPDKEVQMKPGDCITILAGTRHNLKNNGSIDCTLIAFSA